MGTDNKGRMLFDWHTHTTYSHGKGSVEDNVLTARRLGLRSIAITDHGPGHFGYGFRRRDIPAMRRDIDELNARFDDSGKIITEGDQVVLGGNDRYTAMCHKCWKKRIREQQG